jgi:hypothetical protein
VLELHTLWIRPTHNHFWILITVPTPGSLAI